MTLIDGRAVAATIREQVAAKARALRSTGATPTLAILVPTDDEATAWYVRSIERMAEKVDVRVRVVRETNDIGACLAELSADPTMHGVICQTPLPAGMSLDVLGRHIDTAKDVDGANPVSLGRLAVGLPAFAPATAQAVIELLRAHGTTLAGTDVVVVGRSSVVGKPAALLLLAENATVTVCHSHTKDLAVQTSRADVVVACVGRAQILGAAHMRPGAVVIDVGTNPTADGGLVGDVDTAAVEPIAEAITPVPGGVGPVTTALLLRNVVSAAQAASASSAQE
ncbi:MAG: bifunctional 5,10-methylenetetrahydrofolate dehydrogenase/5,10-methenyltetrahydrofolate cyclohydrolase [Kutzneria sp.]|nr:bifunctional 5,10-methylenetetrahydrofolate dehydrogenase/5,10-methenyltetrahydrofolate cyclohydrolase [Kutzneria sp.]MBV9846038.1 bifunctional 5,10-methylenetetrahydrofolate dehydrogenase/5,10-methenyltetrahydrofolate cyclohydrolase [Kutzneria sp.]